MRKAGLVLAALCWGGVSAAYAQMPPGGAADEKEEDIIVEVESLFYSDKEVEKIHQAIIAYGNRGSSTVDKVDFSVDEYIGKAGEIKQARSQERYFTYPQFFLESLVFHTDTDWTIWLNGQRITPTPENNNQEITVTAIDKSQVSLQWKPYDFDKVQSTWAKAANDNVVVDSASGIVSFTLKPNQTFSSYVMRVLEGKVLPVTVDNQMIERDFQQKPVNIDKSVEAMKDIFSGTSEGQDDAVNTAMPPAGSPVAGNPSEIIGIYGDTEKKER